MPLYTMVLHTSNITRWRISCEWVPCWSGVPAAWHSSRLHRSTVDVSMKQCSVGVCAFGRIAVQSAGNPSARIAAIDENPGANELKSGVPFVGRAGQLLDRLLSSAGLARSDLYILNSCQCVVMEREDRRPLPAELDACRPRLLAELDMVSPRVVLLLGNSALSAWFPGYRIGQIINHCRAVDGRVFIASYHPAAALRNPHLESVIIEGLALARRLAV